MIIVVHKVNLIILAVIVFMGIFTWVLYAKEGQIEPTNPKEKLVIIDPGHGGMDGGCSGNSGVLEKDLNLKVSLKLAEQLKAAGISYVMTREKDESIHDDDKNSIRSKKVSDLKNRRELIEQSGCSLFISIHMNKFEQSQYKGAQVFYSKVNPLSKDLADLTQKTLLAELQDGNKREPKKSGNDIYLLKYTSMPAVLVECGFLSNPEEEALLQTDDYQNRVAKALCETIQTWYQKQGQ